MLCVVYRIPESFNAFCSMVSFTAAKTSRMFDVSVACVKLYHVSFSVVSSCLCGTHTEDINSNALG